MEQTSTIFLYDDGFIRLYNPPTRQTPGTLLYSMGYRVRFTYQNLSAEDIAHKRRMIVKIDSNAIHKKGKTKAAFSERGNNKVQGVILKIPCKCLSKRTLGLRSTIHACTQNSKEQFEVTHFFPSAIILEPQSHLRETFAETVLLEWL